MTIKKILNPVDGSECSIKSTNYAIELAKSMDAEIILLYCSDRYPVNMGKFYAHFEYNHHPEDIVEPFIETLKHSDVKFSVKIVEGYPGSKIIEIAKLEKIDLIVMGSRGLTNFIGLIVGSVAHQIIHKSDCPVFITK